MRNYYDIDKLREAGYKVEQKSDYHFWVVGKKSYINVWPSARKWMIAYGSGASYYTDTKDLIEKIRNIAGKKRNPRWLLDQLMREKDAAMSDEEREYYPIWRAGLKVFLKSIKIYGTA